MNITIELTKQQEKFLRQFAERQHEDAHDNLGTYKPLHLVQTRDGDGDYRTVAYFFTLAEARRYTEYQSHNLTNPRTYTVSQGYSNKGDYEPFFDLLMAAGNQVIDLQDKGMHILPGFEDEVQRTDALDLKVRTAVKNSHIPHDITLGELIKLQEENHKNEDFLIALWKYFDNFI